MNENTSTGSITGTEGEMSECAENEENFAGRADTVRCTKATTTTTTVITTQTNTNNVLDTHKQTSTSGDVSGRDTTKPTSEHSATTSTTCGGISGQHSSYLKDNLDIVRQKCSEFHACTVELYKSENLHRILAGDNIQLRNICGLLYQNANGSYRILDNQCSVQERESIKEILGDELSPNLDGSSSREDSWGKLKTCLDNNNSGSTHLDELCRLKGNSTLPLCNSTDVQTTTEKFFNDKLRQHHCICNTFTESSGKQYSDNILTIVRMCRER
ncbi:uncharacterized protein LOC112558608 [Pomacea canaliculata]|uniref:uncharacterized protein LOC112558608 n=1 Tax=Pomacea canaliculata TaxID=400727 RepID=UPI000D72AB15|nr:uncharacterized protein LOC112558608 [Pomacea canaliculata]